MVSLRPGHPSCRHGLPAANPDSPWPKPHRSVGFPIFLSVLLYVSRLDGRTNLQRVDSPRHLAPKLSRFSSCCTKALGPRENLHLLANDTGRQPGWILTVKGMHYLFPVRGDRVKPDSILLVVLGCDKTPDIVALLSDGPGAQWEHSRSKKRLQQGHRYWNKTYSCGHPEKSPLDCLTHAIFVFPGTEDNGSV